MQRPALVFAVMALLALTGCGADEETKTTATTQTSTTPRTTGTSTTDANVAARSCEARGINAKEGKEGTCVRAKQSFTMVDRYHQLKLKQLSLSIVSFSAKSTVEGPTGTVKPAKGTTFVVMNLKVRNRDKRSRVFDEDHKQLKLKISPGAFGVSPKAQAADPKTFFNANKKIKPGGSQSGRVIFQVKERAADALTLRGADPQLLVWNFSTAGEKGRLPDGAIRLWK